VADSFAHTEPLTADVEAGQEPMKIPFPASVMIFDYSQKAQGAVVSHLQVFHS
jgi:hypothetical protein